MLLVNVMLYGGNMRIHGLSRTLIIVSILMLVGTIFQCSKPQDKTSSKNNYKIAAILPISGPNAAQGIGMMNSCEVAIKNINASGQINPLKLELIKLDDESKPEVAVKAAERVGQDANVLAVTAHWNSGCALATNPVFHKYGMANLVPAAINSKITLEQPGDEIFRIDAHDLIITKYAAEFAAAIKGYKKAFILDDNTIYGKELARIFGEEFEGHGGIVNGQDAIQVGEQDFSSILTKIKGLSPDLIFFGGLVTEASLLRRQMLALGLDAKFLSLTGIFTQSFINAAGSAAEGVYSVTVVPPIELLPEAQQFIEEYKKGNYSQPYEAWGIYAYASIQVLAEAIQKALPNPTRRAVIDQLKAGEFSTILGKMRFDQNGQTSLITIWVYQIQNGKWHPLYHADGNGHLVSFQK
jgi:branched-chain amino acid transport system substrate-binding protein